MTGPREEQIREAILLRDSGDTEEALSRLKELHARAPEDPVLNLQMAWTHDRMGSEREAVPYYEAALAGDLDERDALDARLGLGSTLRALGRYEEAVAIMDRAMQQHGSDSALRVFHALALYNSGNAKEACENLLDLLIDTTADERIKAYRPALQEYAEDLDRTW